MRFIVSAACRARLSPAGAEIAERYGTRTVVLGATHDFSPSLAAGRCSKEEYYQPPADWSANKSDYATTRPLAVPTQGPMHLASARWRPCLGSVIWELVRSARGE